LEWFEMAFKRFVRERSERTALIDELKDMIVGGSSIQVKDVVDDEPRVYMGVFLSSGNLAYRSGDADVFEYFLRSLFELVGVEPEGVDCAGLVRRVQDYGFRSVRDFDGAMFGAVVDVVAERVSSMRDVVEIDGWLRFLRDLGLRSAEARFEGGVLAVVDLFRVLGVHFEGEGLGVSAMSLKNHVVGLVHFLGGVGNESLRERVVSLAEGVLAPSPRPTKALVDDGVSADSPTVV
jgi:hypothetical protein